MNIDFGQNLIATKRATNLALGTATFMALSLATASAATPPPTKSGKSGDISGFFLGAEVGGQASFTKETATETNATNTTTTESSVFPIGNVGVKLGYTHFFNKWVGIRGYANYHYGFEYSTDTMTETNTTTDSSLLASYHQVAGNVEATFKFFDLNGVGLGAYAGLGAGYSATNSHTITTEASTTTTTDRKVASGFVLPVNIGLEVYMGKHHNASLNFRIPTIATTLTTTDAATGTTTKYEERNLIITLGYSYTF
ncbi:outer membrane beta-barrel protein [Helicobacter macacae]|uniref:Outer membrane protein beta-barrel domain-containing protein n=1 Tax=Helicobacter macacae MIT 99-5501 TaxID=1357400 RepID=V8C567_9HELI|nr:outer membrane beta-barrel protein [Helicobacter macacae]ETD22170.1 hypothetical protein HMPREF2086_01897 [Helicobacter macacae MIT 99-5501]